MSKRLQIRVPDEIADTWITAADTTGVSLSNWVTMRVNRPDGDRILTQLVSRIDTMSGVPTFEDEEKEMITQLRHMYAGPNGALNLEQVLRLGVRTLYRAVQPDRADLERVRGE